jgi:hypothetical protein
LKNLEISNVQIVIGTINVEHGEVYYPFWWVTYNQWAQLKDIQFDNQVNDIAVIKVNLSLEATSLNRITKISQHHCVII